MNNIKHPILNVIFFTLFFCLTIFCAGQNKEFEQEKADSLYDENQFTEAAKLYTYLFNTTSQVNEQKAKNAFLAGKSYHIEGKQDSAIYWYNKASDIFRKLKKEENYYIVQGQLASIFDDQGNYKSAIEIAEKVVAYFKGQNDSFYSVKTLNNLALYHYHMGNIDKSIELYLETILWAGETNNDLKAKCYNQMGNIWADDLHDEVKALEYYQKSLQLKILSSASAKSISFAYNNIGISHKNLGNIDSAMFYYQMALDFAIASNEQIVKLNPLINIANLQKKQGDLESAIKTFKQALEVSSSASVKQQATLHINLAMNYNELKNYTLALHHLRIAEELTQTTEILADKRDIHLQKAVANSGLKNFEEAYIEQVLAASLNDSLYKREREQEVSDLMLKYESTQKDKALLEQQQIIQQSELEIKMRTIWLISSLGIFLLISGVLFYLFKRKETMANQAALELKLAEEKERTHLQEERLRISRELHDNIGSYLTLVNASVEQFSDMSHDQVNYNLPNLQKVLSLSMRELRKTVWLLNNQEISIDAITLRLRDFFKPLDKSGTHIVVQSEGNTEHILTDIQATHLFRIIQEAVNNAHKYAKSKNIYIHLKVTEKVRFSVSDDGVGFIITTNQNGNGIQNMHSRIRELKGEINIQSEIGRGTTVEGSF